MLTETTMKKKTIFLSLLTAGFCVAFASLAFRPAQGLAATPPKIGTDTLVIPFEYKQSAIVHKFTLDVLDSVVIILNENKEITLSIEGYAYVDEGNDTICKYLSLDRALFVRDAILGRGIDSGRITSIKAMGQWKPEKKGHYKINNDRHCRVELLLIYPPPPKLPVIADRDEDGIPDSEDSCADQFGYAENKGCPLKDVYLVLFEHGQSYISPSGFTMSDKILNLLKQNPSYTIKIGGHAAKPEGIKFVTDHLSEERADIIYRYLLSRNISPARIDAISSYGKSKPVNAQRNPKEIEENACAEVILNRHMP